MNPQFPGKILLFCAMLASCAGRSPTTRPHEPVESGKSPAQVVLKEATSALSRGDVNKALYLYSTHLDAYPADPAVLAARGRLLLSTKNSTSALVDFNAAIKTAPEAFEGYAGRAECYAVMGDLPRSVVDQARWYSLTESRLPKAYLGGIAHAAKGEWEPAIADLSVCLQTAPTGSPVRSDALLWRGIAHARRREWDPAITDLNEHFADHPDEWRGRAERGHAYFEKGLYRAALDDYTAEINGGPSNSQTRYWRGLVYLRAGLFTLAVRDFGNYCDEHKRDPAGFLRKAECHIGDGYWNGAIKDLSWAIELQPDDATPYFNRSVAYFKNGDPKRAIQDLDHYLKGFPQDAGAWNWRGEINQTQSRWDEAAADFENAANLEPTGTRYRLHRATVLLREKGDAAAALVDLDRCVNLVPTDTNTRLLRAEALFELRRYTESAADCRAACGKALASVYARALLGVNLAAMGDAAGARGELRAAMQCPYAELFTNTVGRLDRVLADSPDSTALRAARDFLQPYEATVPQLWAASESANAGRTEQAATQINAVIEKTPDLALAYRVRATILEDQGNLERALADHERFGREYPDSLQLQQSLGTIRLQLKQYPEAKAAFLRALTLNPSDHASASNLGYCLYAEGDLPAALAQYESAAAISGTDPMATRNAARICLRLDRPKDAIGEWTRFLETALGDGEAHRQRGKLRQQHGPAQFALADYDEAERLGVRDAEIYACRAKAYYDLQQFGRADAEYDVARRFDPTLTKLDLRNPYNRVVDHSASNLQARHAEEERLHAEYARELREKEARRRKASLFDGFPGMDDSAQQMADKNWKAGAQLDQQLRDDKRWSDTQRAIDRRF